MSMSKTASGAMALKIKILKELGASDELILMYCPEIPKPAEELSREDYNKWLDIMEEQLLKFCNDELADIVDDAGNAIRGDLAIFEQFMSANSLCPYCAANHDEDGRLWCAGCSFGRMYGKCGLDKGNRWSTCAQWARDQGNLHEKPVKSFIKKCLKIIGRGRE